MGEKLLPCVHVRARARALTRTHACGPGRGGLSVGRVPVGAGVAPGLLGEGGAGRQAGKAGGAPAVSACEWSRPGQELEAG